MPRREQSETVQVGLRMKEPLRLALEKASRNRGVSMNAEIVARLERSFEHDQRIEDVFGSADLFGLMKAVASVMDFVGRSAGTIGGAGYGPAWERSYGWIDHPYAYDQAFRAACRVLEAVRPPGTIEIPDSEVLNPRGASPEEKKQMNEEAVMMIGTWGADAILSKGWAERAPDVHAYLGRLADRIAPTEPESDPRSKKADIK